MMISETLLFAALFLFSSMSLIVWRMGLGGGIMMTRRNKLIAKRSQRTNLAAEPLIFTKVNAFILDYLFD